MAIYLIRHGETAGNAQRIMQVPATPLSPRGIAQAERLAVRLADEGIAEILVSDLERAQMTARPLEASTGARLELDSRLQERNFGDLRGTPYAELERDPFAPGYTPPGGESWEVFHQRVDAGWEIVTQRAQAVSGHLAVVTHGLVCHSLLTRKLHVAAAKSLGASDGEIARFGNTSVTVIEGKTPYRVELLGCTAHLADLPAEGLEGGEQGAPA